MSAVSAPETRTGLVRRARRIDRTLAETYPDARIELDFDGPFQLLVVTVLSAQTTDRRVNAVRPTLFAAYPDAAAMAAAPREQLEQIIGPLGFFRAKTDALLKLSAALVERYDGQVLPRLADLVTLPGVGRKTANVVLGTSAGSLAASAGPTRPTRSRSSTQSGLCSRSATGCCSVTTSSGTAGACATPRSRPVVSARSRAGVRRMAPGRSTQRRRRNW